MFLKLYTTVAMAALVSFSGYSCPQRETGASQDSVAATYNVRKKAEVSDSGISPAWFTHNYLLCDAEEDYKHKHCDTVKPFYSDTDSSFSINEEWLSFYGTDSTGVRKRIKPVNDLGTDVTTSFMAENTLTVTFEQTGTLPGNCAISHDSHALNDLFKEDFDLTSSESVCYGRVLYRSKKMTQNALYGSWKYAHYAAETVLNFSGEQAVQFAVLYEVKEPSPGWPWSDRYYHVRGVYRIDIYETA